MRCRQRTVRPRLRSRFAGEADRGRTERANLSFQLQCSTVLDKAVLFSLSLPGHRLGRHQEPGAAGRGKDARRELQHFSLRRARPT